MKTITTVKWMAVWLLAASLTANAQAPGGGTTGSTPSGGGQGGPDVQHQRPNPEQMATHLMEKFDVNKDGELSQAELTQALESLRAHRPGGEGGARQGGASSNAWNRASSGAAQGNPEARQQQHTPPPADKVAAEMITKFSSDGKGLTQPELAKALAARKAERSQHRRGGQQGGGQTNGTATGSL